MNAYSGTNLSQFSGDRADIPISISDGFRVVQTPHYAPDVMATVLVVELNGEKIER